MTTIPQLEQELHYLDNSIREVNSDISLYKSEITSLQTKINQLQAERRASGKPAGILEKSLVNEVKNLNQDIQNNMSQLSSLNQRRNKILSSIKEYEQADSRNNKAKEESAKFNKLKKEYETATNPEDKNKAKEALEEQDAVVSNLATVDKINRVSTSTNVGNIVSSKGSQRQGGTNVPGSKSALEIADQERTSALNRLSVLQAQGINSGPEYENAKKAVFETEKKFVAARDNNNSQTLSAIDNFIEVEAIQDIRPPSEVTEVVNGNIQTDTELVAYSNDEVTEDNEIVVTARRRSEPDKRVRIRPMPGMRNQIFHNDEDNVLRILDETNGVIFPYTPEITHQFAANYTPMSMTHMNQDFHFYNNTPSIQINISGQFTAQNQREAEYLFASMHFLRTATKMHFGSEEDPLRGMPPPVLLLSGYGGLMFNDIPVIITNFSMQMPSDVNYVEVEIGGMKNWVPSLTTFNISAIVQNTPKKLKEFNWDEFANGNLLRRGGWL